MKQESLPFRGERFNFLFAFVVQYLYGLTIDLWAHPDNLNPIAAYKTAYSCLVALQILALLWLIYRQPHRQAIAGST